MRSYKGKSVILAVSVLTLIMIILATVFFEESGRQSEETNTAFSATVKYVVVNETEDRIYPQIHINEAETYFMIRSSVVSVFTLVQVRLEAHMEEIVLLIVLCLFIFARKRNYCSLLVDETKKYREYMMEEVYFKYVKCPVTLAKIFKQKGRAPVSVPTFVFADMLFTVSHLLIAIIFPVLAVSYNLEGKELGALFFAEIAYGFLTVMTWIIPYFVFKRKTKRKN